MLAILGILGIIGMVGGAIISTIGNVQKATSQATADETKAAQLEELSKSGGYYDQVLKALQSDLTDIAADRESAGKMLALTAAQTAQQGVQVGRQGAAATGSITATAGAGNLGQGGSVAVRKEAVQTAVSEDIASLNRSMEQARLQYEDTLRGLATREAQTISEQTKTQFEKTSGLQDASQLRTEADWLNTWGVPLIIAGGVFQGLSGISQAGGFQTQASAATAEPVTPYDPYANMGGGGSGAAALRQY